MSNPTEKFIDKAGREVLPGDYIIYGHALGRCAGLQYGRVVAVIPPAGDQYRGVCAKIRVRGVDANDNWLGYSGYGSGWRAGELELLKPGTLSFPSRVLKVEPHQIPEAIWKLLDQVEFQSN
jgi:hypothetical protein